MLCAFSGARAAPIIAVKYCQQKGRIVIRRKILFLSGRILKKGECHELLLSFVGFPNQVRGEKCVRSCLNYLWRVMIGSYKQIVKGKSTRFRVDFSVKSTCV